MLFIACGDNIGYDKLKLSQLLAGKGNNQEMEKMIEYVFDNTKDMKSNEITFSNVQNEKLSINLDTFSNKQSFQNYLQCNYLNYTFELKPDTKIFTEDELAEDMLLAYEIWKKYPWSKTVDFDTFCAYILPYKVGAEAPECWRSSMYNKLKSTLDSLAGVKASVETVADILWDIDKGFTFNASDYLKLAPVPSYTELLCSREGDCFGYSLLYAYAFRSAGIPATIDVVPKWGHYNGGHAELAYASNSSGKLVTKDVKRLNRAAKVFRWTFQNNRAWTDSIAPFTVGYEFQVPFINENDRWLDVTSTYSITNDIPYKLGSQDIDVPFAYICVYNSGRWEPIYWGRNINETVIFRNMARRQIYRIAVPDKQIGFRLIDHAFSLNEDGGITNYNVQNSNLDSKNVVFNTLDMNIKYSFWYLKSGTEWNIIDTQKPTSENTITFFNVPDNAIYRISREVGDSSANRLITYDSNGTQIWW
jgi:hypothetical protein